VVAEVDQRLELGERLLADLGLREHRLDLGAVALAQPDEAQLAGVAQEDHPAGDRHVLIGVRVGPHLLRIVRLDDLADGVRALDEQRIGIDARVQHALALLAAHPHLLGQVVLGKIRRLVHEASRYPAATSPCPARAGVTGRSPLAGNPLTYGARQAYAPINQFPVRRPSIGRRNAHGSSPIAACRRRVRPRAGPFTFSPQLSEFLGMLPPWSDLINPQTCATPTWGSTSERIRSAWPLWR